MREIECVLYLGRRAKVYARYTQSGSIGCNVAKQRRRHAGRGGARNNFGIAHSAQRWRIAPPRPGPSFAPRVAIIHSPTTLSVQFHPDVARHASGCQRSQPHYCAAARSVFRRRSAVSKVFLPERPDPACPDGVGRGGPAAGFCLSALPITPPGSHQGPPPAPDPLYRFTWPPWSYLLSPARLAKQRACSARVMPDSGAGQQRQQRQQPSPCRGPSRHIACRPAPPRPAVCFSFVLRTVME